MQDPPQASFGIGCFHFALRKPRSSMLTRMEYLAQLEMLLELIPSITSIEIYANPQKGADWREMPPSNLKAIIDSTGVFPPWRSHRLSFEVYIPSRIQESLTEVLGRPPRIFSEQFHVEIMSSHEEVPVAFVLPLNPSEEPTPSDAVLVVRKYLELECEKLSTNELSFEFLGPSPFHFQLHLYPDDAPQLQRFRTETASDPDGFTRYTRIHIHYNASRYSDAREAFIEFASIAAEELGVYYSYIQQRHRKWKMWLRVMEAASDLARILNPGSALDRAKMWTWGSGRSDALASHIAEFQMEEIQSRHHLRTALASIERSQIEGILFPSAFETVESEEFAYPIAEIQRLHEYSETKRKHRIEVLVNILVGLLAAITGSIVTYYLTQD